MVCKGKRKEIHLTVCGMIGVGARKESELTPTREGERVTSFVNQRSTWLRSLLRWRR